MTSLIDPKNPARWADGSPRSQNNGFTLGLSNQPIDWGQLQRHANLRTTSSRTVAQVREEGGTLAQKRLRGITVRHPKRTAMVSIENAEVGRKSTDRRAAIRKGGI